MATVLYADRKQRGVCVICGETRTDNKLVCSDCRERRRESHKALHDSWKRKGMCWRCGHVIENKEKNYCIKCLSYMNSKTVLKGPRKKKVIASEQLRKRKIPDTSVTTIVLEVILKNLELLGFSSNVKQILLKNIQRDLDLNGYGLKD